MLSTSKKKVLILYLISFSPLHNYITNYFIIACHTFVSYNFREKQENTQFFYKTNVSKI